MATAIEMLNTIRDNSSEEYARIVGTANGENFTQIGQAITSDKNIMNEFINGLINKVGLSYITNRMFNNPLGKLKKQGVPYGSTIEEIFINPPTDMGFQKDGNYLLKNYKTDGKVAYYCMNRQSTYPATITKQELLKAFRNEREFESFFEAKMTSLYSADQIDEFILNKKLLAKTIDEGHILTIDADASKPKELAKAITNFSKQFTFPKTAFAPYNLVNKGKFTETDKECITFCPKANQVLYMRSDIDTELGYEVLASMFHMEVAKIEAMTILVDDFPSTSKDIFAILADQESLQMRDVCFEVDNQYIGSNMSWNIWLHHWQYQYVSMFGNIVAFASTKATS